MACGWQIIFLHNCSNDLIRIQSLHIPHVLSHPYRGEVAWGWGMEGGGCAEGGSATMWYQRIVHLPSGHLTKWEISFSTEELLLRILAATHFKTTVSLLNNHLCAYLDPLHEPENSSTLFGLFFPFSPRPATFLTGLPFSSLLLLFPNCKGNQKKCARLLHQALFQLPLDRFSAYSKNSHFPPFPPFQKLVSSDPDGTLSPDKLLGISPPLAALLWKPPPHASGNCSDPQARSELLLLLGCTIPSPLQK